MDSSVSVIPYMLMPGEEKLVAARLYATLSKPPVFQNPEPPPQGTPAAVAGQWEARLEFGRGSANHTIVLEQDGSRLVGTHHTEFYAADLTGAVAANSVRFQTSFQVHGQRLGYAFTGTAEGDKMAGVVALGEYGETSWTAERHKYRAPTGRRG
jgi:L-seryl-tRNA(Ser) seleniumtransferase